jgi:hypothetical protein
MTMHKINTIRVDGHYVTCRIAPWDYHEKIAEFATDGIKLPKWCQLRRLGDTDGLWLLMEPITVTVTFKNGEWWQWLFDKGFIWDQASVPVFKNNVLEAIIPAMCHDGAFSLHWYDFKTTNKLFYRMLRKFGMNPIRAAIYYLAVNSMFGRAIWEKNSREFWHKKTAHFMQGRKNDN